MKTIAPEMLEDIDKGVEAAVAHYRRRRAPGDQGDMRQEAWEIALVAARTYDPGVSGNLSGYIYVAVRRSLGARISNWLSVPSVHGDMALARQNQTRVRLDGDSMTSQAADGSSTRSVPADLVDRWTPEDALLERRRLGERGRWAIRFRRMVLGAMSGWSSREVEVIERLHGLDGGPPASAAAVASAMAIDVKEVYRLTDRFKKEISCNLGLYGLGKQLKEIMS